MILEELSKPLRSDVIKQRKQGNFSLSYIEGHHAIREANRIFGFCGWERVTSDLNMVQCEQKETNNGELWYVSYTCKSRVTVMDTTRDGVGFGQGQDRDLGRAHESAIKEAETDAMKRALMTFGDPFGLALYDKDQAHVAKASAEPVKAKPREGRKDAGSPFGWWLPPQIEGDWQGKVATDQQMSYWTELCAKFGIELEERTPFRRCLCHEWKMPKAYFDKQAGFSMGIEFLKDAPDDSIELCLEKTKKDMADALAKKQAVA